MASEGTFTAEELSVLAAGLGVPAIPGLEDVMSELPQEQRSALTQSASRGLIARRVLVPTQGGCWVDPTLAALVQTASSPALLCTVLREQAGYVSWRQWGVLRPLAVEHQQLTGGLHRLESLSPEAVPDCAIRFAGLASEPRASGEAFDVEIGTLQAAAESVHAGRRPDAENLLRRAGASPGAAAGFARALSQKRGSAQINVIWREGPDTLHGLDLTWLDGGAAGLWKTPSPPWAALHAGGPDPAATIRVEPVSGEALLEEFAQALPPGLPAPTATW